MKSAYIFFFLFIFLNHSLWSQTKLCGTDVVMEKYRNTDRFKDNQSKILQGVKSLNLDPKIIPVVFHIIHNGNPIGEQENISMAQINDAMSILNEDYNAVNEDLDNVVESFQDIIGNTNVEFRLAQLDPDGNCTNGVNRVFSSLTNQANDCVKEVISWDDTRYVNIWVVEDIDSDIGAAAYTYLPGTLWGNEVEGIIINHEYVGSIGASSNTPYKRHTLTHEFGHFFNLEHTWGWGSNGDLNNCNSDDSVDDTPNTIGAYSSCNLLQESCGDLDNIQNFMDYSSCTCMFTNGQVDRMESCLNSSISNRNNLWSSDNLWLTGTHDNYVNTNCIPDVQFFISQVERICIETPLTLINNTQNSGEDSNISWLLPGSDLEFSSEQNPVVTYSQPGEYDITLNVINESGENSITKTYIVYSSQTNLNESFENTSFPVNDDPSLSWSIIGPENETSWARTPISSTATTGSVRIRSRFFDCYQKHFLYTPNLDLSNFGLGGGDPLKVIFDMAYGKRNNESDDLLRISYSKDCGETWQVRATYDTNALITTIGGNVGNNFIPNNNEWVEKSVNIQAAAGQNDVIIRFEFSGDKGSYLYIDNVRLMGEWLDLDNPHNRPSSDLIRQMDFLGRTNNNSKLGINVYKDGSVKKVYEIK